MKLIPLKRIIVLVIVALIISIGLYFYTHIEKHTITQPTESSAAKNNPYLAIEYFLKNQQYKVVNKNNLNLFKSLPPEKQTVLLLGQRAKQTQQQNQQILNWVNQGGTLIIEAYSVWNPKDKKSDDLLLDQLGIQLSHEKSSSLNDDQAITKLYLENSNSPALLNFKPFYHLEDTQNKAYAWANSGNNTTHIMQLHYGKGSITIISDADIWKNNSIKNYDHAWFLEYLTANTDVTIMYSPKTEASNTQSQPSLLTEILKNYSYSLFICVLLLIAILWYKGVRVGPLEPIISRNRKRLPEQLNAQANFLLKHTGQQQLVAILQQDINQKAKQRHSRFEELPVEQQWKLLSTLSNQPTKTIASLMGPKAQQKSSKPDFIKTVIALQAIRNTL